MARQIYRQILPRATRSALIDLADRAGIAQAELNKIARVESKRALIEVRNNWPVDTGFSKALFQIVNTGRLGFAIANRVVYSGYVHRKGEKVPLAQTLIPRAAEQAALRIVNRVQELARKRLVAQTATTGQPGRSGILDAFSAVSGLVASGAGLRGGIGPGSLIRGVATNAIINRITNIFGGR